MTKSAICAYLSLVSLLEPARAECSGRFSFITPLSIPPGVSFGVALAYPDKQEIDIPVSDMWIASRSALPCGSAQFGLGYATLTPTGRATRFVLTKDVSIREDTNVEVDLGALSFVFIDVVTPTGARIADASVSLVPVSTAVQSLLPAIAGSVTDFAGRAVLPVIAADYKVSVDNFSIAEARLDDNVVPSPRLHIEPGRYHRVRITVEPVNTVSVFSAAADGTPAAGIDISWTSTRDGESCSACALTSLAGTAQLSLRSFPVTVSFHDPQGQRDVEPSKVRLTEAPSEAIRVTVTPAKGSPLTIRVTDNHGAGVASARVSISFQDLREGGPAGLRELVLDDGGKATALLPEECVLQLRVQPPTATGLLSKIIEARREFGTEEVVVEMASTILVRAIVRYPDSSPAVGTWVTLSGTDGVAEPSRVDADGRVAIAVSHEGTYYFTLTSPVDWKGKQLRVVSRREGRRFVEPPLVVKRALLDKREPESLQLAVGEPICVSLASPVVPVGESIELRAAAGEPPVTMTVKFDRLAARDATICTPPLPDGAYRVLVSGNVRTASFAPQWWADGRTIDQAVPVRIEGGRAPALSMRLHPAGSVLLHLRNQRTVEAGGQVQLCALDSSSTGSDVDAGCVEWQSELVVQDRLSEAGAEERWVAVGVPPGRWRARVCTTARCSLSSEAFVVVASKLSEIDVLWPADE